MLGLYTFIKVLHIFFAMVAVGGSLTYRFLMKLADREPHHLLFMLRTIRWIDRRVSNPCYLLVLATGITLVWLGNYSYKLLWIWLPLVIYGVIAILGITLYAPIIKKQLQLIETGTIGSTDYQRVKKRSALLGNIVTFLVVIILVVMVWKPA